MTESQSGSGDATAQQASQGGLGGAAEQELNQGGAEAGEPQQPGLFSRPPVKQQFKAILLMYVFAGAGYAGSATLVLTQLGEEQMLFLGGVIVPATVSMMFITPTLLGVVAAVHTQFTLRETGTDLYTATAIPVFIGSVVFMVTTTFVLGFEVETGLELGEMLVPFAAAAGPAGVSTAAVAWALDN